MLRTVVYDMGYRTSKEEVDGSVYFPVLCNVANGPRKQWTALWLKAIVFHQKVISQNEPFFFASLNYLGSLIKQGSRAQWLGLSLY